MSNKKRIVIALGGNALGNTLPEQMAAVTNTAKPIADLIEDGHEVIIVHGNGPQVGMINNAMAELYRVDKTYTPTPLSVCGAMSQAYIGYDLQNAISYELTKRGIRKPVCTLVTQVRVDGNDPAFENPTKPIGKFLSKEEAEELAAKTGDIYKEDAGRGYRRYVASPKPVEIIEAPSVEALVNAGQVVITCGGGGIPVVYEDGRLDGTGAVIDKDFASCLLAEELNADMLIILTAVEKVAINFRKENEEWLSELTPNKAKQYIAEGQFAPGSMLPKVEAAVKFAQSKIGREALITLLEKAQDGINGLTGTRVHL
ncbi:MAG: carbamate kinase [Clostridiales bacterium]|nr:carbamate kinase [Clostridiales bacterium]